MNERILKLAEQAHEFAVSIYEKRLETEKSSNVFFYKIKDKKFAELIVNECCQQLLKEDIRYGGYGYNQYGLHNKLREHFKVEE